MRYESDRAEIYAFGCHDDNNCLVSPMADDFMTEAGAIAAWNTRHEGSTHE